jgi:hypothetical protein
VLDIILQLVGKYFLVKGKHPEYLEMSSIFLNIYFLIICLERTNTAKKLSKNLSLPKPKYPVVKKNDNKKTLTFRRGFFIIAIIVIFDVCI